VSNNSFAQLIESYSDAYKSQDWDQLVLIGDKIGALVGGKLSGTIRDIREIAKIYLGSLMGSGKFLTTKDADSVNKLVGGLENLEKFASRDNNKLLPELSPIIRSGYEIQLYLTRKQSDSRNKAASAFRNLARPDLAIFLTTQQLEITRLNYYSLVVRAAAYSDISSFNEAISDGQKALKYSPVDKKHFSLVTLSRAHLNRFKQTGDISDCELAFELAEKSFELKPDEYSANIFLRVIHTISLPGMDDLIANLRNVQKTNHFELDQKAIEIAKEVIRNSSSIQITQSLTSVDDLLADELFDGWLDLENDDDFESVEEEVDHPEDYFEDYFEDFVDSLNDPQNPHLEP